MNYNQRLKEKIEVIESYIKILKTDDYQEFIWSKEDMQFNFKQNIKNWLNKQTDILITDNKDKDGFLIKKI